MKAMTLNRDPHPLDSPLPKPTAQREAPHKKPLPMGWLIALGALIPFSGLCLGATIAFTVFMMPDWAYEQIENGPWEFGNVQQMSFVSNQDFFQAEQALIQAAANPGHQNNPTPHFLLGELYNTLNLPQKSMRHYKKSIGIANSNGLNRILYQRFVHEAEAALAILYYEAKKPEEALAWLGMLPPETHVRNAALVQSLRDSLENPDRADYHLLLGKAFRDDFRLASARQEIQKAEQLGISLHLKREARHLLNSQLPQQLVQLSPMARYYSLAGEAYQNNKDDLAIAASFYEKAVRENPIYEWGYNELAIIYRELNNTAKAKTHAYNAIALNPNFYNPHLTLGDLALDQEDYSAAIQHFQQAQTIIKRFPNEDEQALMANIENQVAYAYESLENYTQAAHHYYQALLSAVDATNEMQANDFEYAQMGLSRVKSLLAKQKGVPPEHLSWKKG